MIMLDFLEADLSDEEWDQIRALAETAITQNLFGQCPIRCVINSYLTWHMANEAEKEKLDEPYIH